MSAGLFVNCATHWHARPAQLARLVADAIAGEVVRQRPGGAPLPAGPWPFDTALDESGLGLDSLERLALATSLSETLHLHESGIEDLLLAKRLFGEWVEVAAAGLRHFDRRVTFLTSGSTGTPKPCTHALAALEQEVEYLAGLAAGTMRVLSAVPAHHIYGFLFTVLLPARLGDVPVLDVRQHTPQSLCQILREGDLVISHPAHWALVARHARRLPAGVRGVTSTAPCPDEVASELAQRGLSELLQIYGSSETAGIGWRLDARSPFTLMPFWSRDGQDDSRLWRCGPDGARESHRLQDRLCWHDERSFGVRGRNDEAVQVGGINVFPAHVRQVLLEHPGVADAAVRLMAPHEGARLKAFVVAHDASDLEGLRAELERWVQARLGAPERPKAFSFGSALPTGATGKLSDWPL